jgi:hypothetical protein
VFWNKIMKKRQKKENRRNRRKVKGEEICGEG